MEAQIGTNFYIGKMRGVTGADRCLRTLTGTRTSKRYSGGNLVRCCVPQAALGGSSATFGGAENIHNQHLEMFVHIHERNIPARTR